MDIEDIAKQVQENCEISDAKHWGSYTICGLLIRLMDLYRWSGDIEQGVKIENPELMEWVGGKEEKWKEIKDDDYKNIVIDGEEHDVFDVERVNKILRPEGFVYGAGYVTAMKPSFFLGEIEELRTEDGIEIVLVGKELARDLIANPALLQGETIFVRTQPARSFMWGKIAEFKFTGNESLKRAFAHYGVDIDDADADSINRVAAEELEIYIRHEIGEARDTAFPHGKWEEIVSAYPLTLIEKFARAVKDILADTGDHGTLRYIIDNERQGSLKFYTAFLSELRRTIFPGIVMASESFDGDWKKMEEARQTAHKKAGEYAQKLVEMYDGGSSQEEIEEELIKPLLPSLD